MRIVAGTDERHRKRLHAALNTIGAHHNGMQLKDFEHLVEKNNTLLLPVFQMQLLLRDRTVGSRFLRLQHVKASKFTFDKSLPEIIETLEPTRKPMYIKGYSEKPAGTSSRKASGKVVPKDESKTGHISHRSKSAAHATLHLDAEATIHKHDYVANHTTGHEMHAATEHHEYLLHPSHGDGGSPHSPSTKEGAK